MRVKLIASCLCWISGSSHHRWGLMSPSKWLNHTRSKRRVYDDIKAKEAERKLCFISNASSPCTELPPLPRQTCRPTYTGAPAGSEVNKWFSRPLEWRKCHVCCRLEGKIHTPRSEIKHPECSVNMFQPGRQYAAGRGRDLEFQNDGWHCPLIRISWEISFFFLIICHFLTTQSQHCFHWSSLSPQNETNVSVAAVYIHFHWQR